MTLDLDILRACLPTIKAICESNMRNGKSPYELGGIVAVAVPLPVLAANYFIGELFGVTEELQAEIDYLIKFYGYTSIRGVRTSTQGD